MHPLLRHTGPLNTELIVTEISIFVVRSNPLRPSNQFVRCSLFSY